MSVLPRGWGWDVMSEIRCRRCAGTTFVRNGTVRGHQRYRCKACGCIFTATPGRGKPAAMKALAVLLYGLGNASQGTIARLLGVGQPRRGLQVDPGGGRGRPGTLGRGGGRPRPDRRDVALREREKTRLALAGRRPCGTANPGLGAGWA